MSHAKACAPSADYRNSQWRASPNTTQHLRRATTWPSSLARDLKGTGVTSNIVSPGCIRVSAVEDFLTGVSERLGWGESWSEIEAGACRDFIPNDIGRLGRPEEIAGAVAYLASPHADYVSGAMIRVDGGLNRSIP